MRGPNWSDFRSLWDDTGLSPHFPVPISLHGASGIAVSDKHVDPQFEDEPPLIVAVVEDLFFGTKIADAAKRAGAGIVFATASEALWRRIEAMPALLIFDLACEKLQPLEVLRQLKADSRYAGIPTLGFLPHVREDLRREAVAAGCATVLPRSAFASRMDAVIREALGGVIPA